MDLRDQLLEAIGDKLDVLAERFGGLDARMQAGEARMDRFEGGLIQLNREVAANGERLERLDATVAANGERLERLDATVAANGERLERLDATVAANGERLERLDATVAANGERIAANGERLERLDATVAGNGERLDRIAALAEASVALAEASAEHLRAMSEQGRFVVRYLETLSQRDKELGTQVQDLRRRVDVLEEHAGLKDEI